MHETPSKLTKISFLHQLPSPPTFGVFATCGQHLNNNFVAAPPQHFKVALKQRKLGKNEQKTPQINENIQA